MLTNEEQKLYWKAVEDLKIHNYNIEKSGGKLKTEEAVDYLRSKFLEYGIINKI